jgi:hypothetical protein
VYSWWKRPRYCTKRCTNLRIHSRPTKKHSPSQRVPQILECYKIQQSSNKSLELTCHLSPLNIYTSPPLYSLIAVTPCAYLDLTFVTNVVADPSALHGVSKDTATTLRFVVASGLCGQGKHVCIDRCGTRIQSPSVWGMGKVAFFVQVG